MLDLQENIKQLRGRLKEKGKLKQIFARSKKQH